MKKENNFIILLLIMALTTNNLFAQISICSDNFPSTVGTLIITEDDTVNDVEVDVGLPGENRTWRLDQAYPSVLTRHQIVEKSSIPFHSDFPDANVVTHYNGKLGSLFHSYYCDNIYGSIYYYQKKTVDSLLVLGFGLDSAIVKHDEYSTNFSGSINFQPGILLYSLPLQYGQSWASSSHFSVEMDTMLFNQSIKLINDVTDSIASVVDGWGTLILPDSSYECLRVKSYITFYEDLYLNGISIRPTRTTRTINYNWVTKKYGIIARVISHSHELDDNFTIAKQVSRLKLFNPNIKLSIADTSAAVGDSLILSIYVSDLTDLNISSIQMKICCDTSILKPLEAYTEGTLTELWGKPDYALSDSGIILDLNGEASLSGQGVLCSIRFLVNPNAQVYDSTNITFSDVAIEESGATISSHPGKFFVQVLTGVKNKNSKNSKKPEKFLLYPNYPNPFNSGTSITYQIPRSSEVNLKIYNSLGQVVSVLVDEHQESGIYNIHWNGQNPENREVPSGIYFYRLNVKPAKDSNNTYEINQKMILLR